MGLWGLPGATLTDDFIRLFNPAPFAVLVGLPGASPRWWPALRAQAALALAVMVGAGVTTQLLKPLLAVQREYPAWHFMGPEAYPSGHTTAVMSFALALVIVTPSRLRPLAAAGGGLLTVATVFSILVHGGALPERRGRRLPGGDRLGVPRSPLRCGSRRGRASRAPAIGGGGAGGGGLLLVLCAPGGRHRLRGREHDLRARRAGDRRRGAGAQR